MKTGMQLTSDTPVSRHASAYACAAFCDPTGRYDTRISAPLSRNSFATSTGRSSATRNERSGG